MTMSKDNRVAIALNNVAVTLQERRCCKQAQETFRDALALMKEATHQPSTEKIRHADLVMHQALQRLAKPEPTKQGLFAWSFDSLSVDSDLSSAMQVVSRGCHSSRHGVLIRLEEAHDEEERDLDLDTAVILHNYGVSCLAQSRVAGSMGRANQLCQGAIRLLQLSHSITIRRTVSLDDKTGTDIRTCVLVTLVATQSMAQALWAANLSDFKLNRCLEKLELIKKLVEELGVLDPLSQGTACAAAA